LMSDKIGIPKDLAVRINLASAGIWWLTFAFFTWVRLRTRHSVKQLPKNETYIRVGFRQLWKTIKEMKNFPETLKFLLAYFLYNDGIQTVIAVSSTFAVAPLVRGGVEMGQDMLIVVILMIQFMAFFGALLWGKLANWFGAKRSIIVSLIIWSGVVIYAYLGLKGSGRVVEFFILGAFIAMVMGGSQAISRSLYAQIIPAGKQAEYYSFYEVSERGTSWIGPLLFGLVNQVFGSLRPAILSLIFFFILGLIILPFVNIPKAMEDVKKFEAKEA
jgi:UMF1 family MFS transporter